MNIRSVVASFAMVASVCVPGAMYASPTTSVHNPVHAIFSKPQKVTLNLRNDGAQAVTVKAGEQEITLAPGTKQKVKLTAGDRIVAVAATPNHAAGELLSVVDTTMSQATVGIK